MVDGVPRLLGGRYEVRDLIGRGGMAEVYIGYDSRLSRTVAIKVLRSDLSRDPMFHARFRREAQSAAGLNHPSIVAVYDTGEDDIVTSTGETIQVPYIVMEYVEGHTVSSLIVDGTPVPIDEAVEITVGVLSALAYSHREGIVHRDIKPGNVMLTPTGQIKVMDFGIARAMADSAATMTQTHSVIGTAQYLSPEQARGEVVDTRSDIYSTGCLLYELLVGKPPFSGDSAVAVAYQHVREIPAAPSAVAPDIPEALDRIVLKALAKDREERYPDAAAMRGDLEAAVRGGAVMAPAVSSWAAAAAGSDPTVVSPSSGTQMMPATRADSAPEAAEGEAEEDEKRSPWWVWLLVLIGLAAAVGIGWLLLKDSDAPTTPETTTVPALEGLDETGARNALKAEDLVLVVGEPEASDDVEEGYFISSDPAPDAEAEVDSKVEVVFSAGPDAVAVPDVIGRTQEQAVSALEAEGLKVSRVETVDDPEYDKDRVASTDPAPGNEVLPGSGVVLTVATGNVEVPDVTGMSLEEAEDALRGRSLYARRVDQPSGDHDPGTVLEQSQSGVVERFTTIDLTVATEPPEPTTEEPTTEEPTTEEPTTEEPTTEEPTTEEPPPDDDEAEAEAEDEDEAEHEDGHGSEGKPGRPSAGRT